MAWLAIVAGGLLSKAASDREAQGAELAGASAQKQGRAKRALDEFEAQQLEENASNTQAAAQRDALEQTRQATLVESRAKALAAAGGAGGPGVINLVSKINGEGAYRSLNSVYEGESQARSMRLAAAGKRYEGQKAEELGSDQAAAYDVQAGASQLKGFASLIGAGGSLYSKYGSK